MLQFHVHFLPTLVDPQDLRGGNVVVIDVLRATTTIAAAIAAGAREVIPCGEVVEAQTIAAKFATGQVILGGERGGLLIPGFDLGNSPRDYTPERVGGKTVVFTTTNGTQAMLRCKQAARVFTGAFVNASAIAQAVWKAVLEGHDQVHLLCAGTRGRITREDVLLAGCLAQKLGDYFDPAAGIRPDFDDQGEIAVAAWDLLASTIRGANAAVESQQLGSALSNSQGGHDLQRLQLAKDIFDAAEVDRWVCVPELDLVEWTIRALAQ